MPISWATSRRRRAPRRSRTSGPSADSASVGIAKFLVGGALERLCQSLELTDAQFLQAKERYEAVGSWLDGADNPVLRALEIYLQGSTALGTTVRPINRTEHDVDLIARCPDVAPGISPTALKKTIGERLRANARYASILEEKARCWRLSYANEFHLDITPAIPNPQCRRGGELVPDRELRQWSPSNPRGYRSLFERRAALRPAVPLTLNVPEGLRAEVETYPRLGGPKGILRRVVQVVKRHRDQFFSGREQKLAPISVILTTLASRSYEHCTRRENYNNEFDFLFDVIHDMPRFIEVQSVDGRPQRWFVWNETTEGENFAEKWNEEPSLERAFRRWHRQAVEDLGRLLSSEGFDELSAGLSRAFGARPASRAMADMTQRVSAARSESVLSVAPSIGLTMSKAPRATSVRSNTFYGRS